MIARPARRRDALHRHEHHAGRRDRREEQPVHMKRVPGPVGIAEQASEECERPNAASASTAMVDNAGIGSWTRELHVARGDAQDADSRSPPDFGIMLWMGARGSSLRRSARLGRRVG